MALRCPRCDGKIKSPRDKKTILCPECGEKFRVNDRDDQPFEKSADKSRVRDKKTRTKASGIKPIVLVALGGGIALVGLLVVVIVVTAWAFRREAPKVAEGPPAGAPPGLAMQDKKKFDEPPPDDDPPVLPHAPDLPRLALPKLDIKPIPRLPAEADRPYVAIDPGGHTGPVRRAFFLRGDQFVATISADRTVRFWEVATGDSVHAIRLPMGPANQGTLTSGEVSPDGRWLAVGGLTVGAGKYGELIYLISLETGRVARVLQGHHAPIIDIAFSHSGRYLASTSLDGSAILYDHERGEVVRVFAGHKLQVASAVFSPDDKLLATVGRDRTTIIWDIVSGKSLVTLKDQPAEIGTLAFNPVRPEFATANYDGTISIWRLDGQRVDTFFIETNVKRITAALRYSADGRELLHGGVQGTWGDCGIIDVAQKKLRLKLRMHSNTLRDVRFSHDGQFAVTTGGDHHETYVWRVKDGSVVQKIQGAGKSVWGVGWKFDGTAIGWTHANAGRLSKLEHSFVWGNLHFGATPDAQFGRIISQHDGWTIRQTDALHVVFSHNDKPVHTFRGPMENESLYCWTLLPNKRAVIGSPYGLYLVDISSNKILREYRGHNGSVFSVSPSPDGEHFLTGSDDMTMALWDVKADTPLVSLFVAGREWVAWTPQGYYAASPYGERLMGWLINDGVAQIATFHPAARFHASLYQPDLIRYIFQEKNLAKAMALAKKNQPQGLDDLTLAQVLPPEVQIVTPGGAKLKINQAEMEIKAKATSTGNFPVTGLRLLVDGRPYRGGAGLKKFDPPKVGAVEATWKVDLLPGKHTISVIAESSVSKGMSAPLDVTRAGAAKDELPNLYVLAAGISAYPGDLKLNFAHKDAIALEKILKERSAGVFRNVETRLLTDEGAGRQSILDGLDWLNKKMTPKDVAVVFFAGHGTRDKKGRFHFIPVDCNLAQVEETCIAGDLLKAKLAELPGRVLVMLDACHSGAAASGAGRKALADDLMRELVSEDYGIVVMSSSQAFEVSMESSEVQHGFFTLSLLEGLAGKADFNQDKYVYFHEVDSYAGARVRQLSDDRQNPTTGRPPHIRSFPLGKAP